MIEIENKKDCVKLVDDESVDYIKHVVLTEDYTILPNIYDIETGLFFKLSEDNEQVFIMGTDDVTETNYYVISTYISHDNYNNKELKILFFNTTNEPIVLKKGTCIAEIFYSSKIFNGYTIYNQNGLNIKEINKEVVEDIEGDIDSENIKSIRINLKAQIINA